MSGRQITADAGSPTNYGAIILDVFLAGGALGVLVVSVLFTPGGLPALPLCPFHHLTGLPCPGCGLTRAFCAIGHGDFGDAWDLNPFCFLFYAATLCLLVWPFVRRKWPAVERRLVLSPWFGGGAILVIVAMWVFGTARIIGMLCARC